ncbi:MAG: response regulator [Gammaproteobacteria bacterium]|nr:response regulator [Gammaproteobacteria bacterium]MCF6260385.1 response regulator [Gammaproteobacteria bacterium]
MKILIAEDNSDIRMLHQKRMSRWGYHVDLASNGKEAVDYVQKTGKKNIAHYDLCLMDINMSIMNGIEAIQTIRKKTPYLPVIAYSANMDNKAASLKAGADEFLLKPHPSKTLKEKLEECAVKQIVLYLGDETLSMSRIGPANSEELTELRRLDKKGIAKFTVIGAPFQFLAHKNIQHKLLHEFNNSDFQYTELLDRTHEEHSMIQIHASKIWLKKQSLTPEQFQKMIEEENEQLKKYENPEH